MTVEHKLVVGLDDVTAVTFECTVENCHGRATVSPDHAEIPSECPACHRAWNVSTKSEEVASPYYNFVKGLVKIRTLLANGARFRILLEFTAP
jgi:hypothetical protein